VFGFPLRAIAIAIANVSYLTCCSLYVQLVVVSVPRLIGLLVMYFSW